MTRSSKQALHVLTLLGAIYVLGCYVPRPLPVADPSHVLKTVVITGANSGVGFETARQLAVDYGVKVALGCRSKTKCDTAATIINDQVMASTNVHHGPQNKAVPVIIDLADFQSVNTFVSQLEGIHVDVVLNNAGYSPDLHPFQSISTILIHLLQLHLSHFLLAKELFQRNPSMRVINTSSASHQLCAMSFAFLPRFIVNRLLPDLTPGCIDDDF